MGDLVRSRSQFEMALKQLRLKGRVGTRKVPEIKSFVYYLRKKPSVTNAAKLDKNGRMPKPSEETLKKRERLREFVEAQKE